MANAATLEQIKKFAEACGLTDVVVTGDELTGEGRTSNDLPLVWTVVKLANISWGCGNESSHQIKADLFHEKDAYLNLDAYTKELQYQVENKKQEEVRQKELAKYSSVPVEGQTVEDKLDVIIRLLKEIKDGLVQPKPKKRKKT